MNAMDILKAVLLLFAGLGVFLIGLDIMGKNIETVAGDSLRSLFTKISDKKLLGIGTGCVTTILTQSSTATTVMTVGFVNTGIMTLTQATTIIMGANIGTTVTAYLIALQNLPISAIFCSMACVGAFMQMSKKESLKNIGLILSGVGMLFVGLYVMSTSMSNVINITDSEGNKVIANIILKFSGDHFYLKLLLMIIGAILTAILHSSAATTSILIGLCSSGAMTLEPAFYVTLGMNIGTCLTAVVASLGQTTNAKRASMVHLLFNIIGTLIFGLILIIFGKQLIGLLNNLKFGTDEGTSISMKIAVFHTVFNVTTTLLMYPFVKQLAQLATLIVRDNKNKNESQDSYSNNLVFLDDRILKTPSIAMLMLKKEIIRMGNLANDNLQLAMEAILTLDLSEEELFKKRENHINFLNKEISKYLVKISHLDISFQDEQIIASYYHVISDLERVGDYAENIMEYTHDLIKSHTDFSEHAKKQIARMHKAIQNQYSHIIDSFERQSLDDKAEIIGYEDLVDTLFTELSNEHIIRLNNNECKIESASSYISLISNLERIGDHYMNVYNSMSQYVKAPTTVNASIVKN